MTPLTAPASAHARDAPHLPHQHTHASLKQQRTTPLFSPAAPTPYSVGQSRPPPAAASKLAAKSPYHNQDVRTPSPNYFGLAVDTATDYTSSGAGTHARANWSPPNSNVRSTAVASPHFVPLDQNPDLQAFRKQTESFGFPSARLGSFSMAPPTFGTKSSTRSNADELHGPTSPRSQRPPPQPTSPKINTSTDNENPPLTPKQRSPKRLLSSTELPLTDRPRRNSPAGFNQRVQDYVPAHLATQNAEARSSVPPSQAATRPPLFHQRSQTVPAQAKVEAGEDGSDEASMITPQHLVNLLDSQGEDMLLLDVRVSSHYASSRITGALNLCIPPLLLKRPAYNLQRLAETFGHVPEQKQKFERWRTCQYIIVYDASSSQLKDAAGCTNLLGKFVSEGWKGFQYVIKGGYRDVARLFPDLIAHGADAGDGVSLDELPPESKIAPVIGGCPMPAATTKTAANPFFGNIRQNMDLIGGVGQMDVQQPDNITMKQLNDMPNWLQEASNPQDHGKNVADKFLQIEKREQKRMQDALSSNVAYGTPKAGVRKLIQLAGIEKGAKNRYNNIWPFEHSRVKLEGIGRGGCDYVNANYLKATGSNKRYIATQSPIPATFADFWTLVWQQDVRVILMLTAEQEGGQVKAHNYWSDRHYGPFNLKFLSEHRASIQPGRIQAHRQASKNAHGRPGMSSRSSTTHSGRNPSVKRSDTNLSNASSNKDDNPYVTVRRFILAHTAQPFAPPREVTHLQYTNWPDFGAPAHPAHLLGLVEQTDAVVRASYGSQNMTPSSLDQPEAREQARPVLVHCSAGCGRTGTFCTVDTVIDMLKRQMMDSGVGIDDEDVEEEEEGGEDAMDTDSSPERVKPMNNITTTARNGNTSLAATASTSALTKSITMSDASTSGFDFGDYLHTATAAEPNTMQDDNAAVDMTTTDLIEQTVEEFRHQRLSSVQSLRQYVLCYESVMEWLVEHGNGPQGDS